MQRRESAFTLIEILVVLAIIATIAGLVVVILPGVQRRGIRLECTNNVRGLVGLVETISREGYPAQGGPNAVMTLVQRGEIGGRDMLQTLFCPGDVLESLNQAGGTAAYEGLDLSQSHGHLTSYACSAQRPRKGAVPPQVIVADDSGDHHDQEGIVIGLTGGIAKWRDKFDDYELAKEDEILVGAGSSIEELRSLRVE